MPGFRAGKAPPSLVIQRLGFGPVLQEAIREALPAPLRPEARRAALALEPRLDGGEVWTDDHAPVEWLVDESLLEYANE